MDQFPIKADPLFALIKRFLLKTHFKTLKSLKKRWSQEQNHRTTLKKERGEGGSVIKSMPPRRSVESPLLGNVPKERNNLNEDPGIFPIMGLKLKAIRRHYFCQYTDTDDVSGHIKINQHPPKLFDLSKQRTKKSRNRFVTLNRTFRKYCSDTSVLLSCWWITSHHSCLDGTLRIFQSSPVLVNVSEKTAFPKWTLFQIRVYFQFRAVRGWFTMTHKVIIIVYIGLPCIQFLITLQPTTFPNGHHQPPGFPNYYFIFIFSNDRLDSIISIMFY